MTRYRLLDKPSSVALGILEMQMQLGTASIPQLVSMPVGQWKNCVIDEIYRCEGCVLWQGIYYGEFFRIEENHQH
jgi:hypothetical protein